MKGPLNYWSAFGVKQTVESQAEWIKGHQKLSLRPQSSSVPWWWVGVHVWRTLLQRYVHNSPTVLSSGPVKVQQELTSVFLTYRLGLWVHREAGGDSGEAPDLWPRGSSACEVPLRLCTESVRWRAWHRHTHLETLYQLPANLHMDMLLTWYTNAQFDTWKSSSMWCDLLIIKLHTVTLVRVNLSITDLKLIQ